MLDRVARFITRHNMLASGKSVGVAVSGGADSVFLLHALRELAPGSGWRLSVIHIEHGIRGTASLADAESVGRMAHDLGLPFHIHHADVPAMDGNLEQAARQVRQKFYSDLIASGTVERVATGHTRSDQAETVLHRILRGSGLAGLAGILPITREGVIRPLLEIDRPEIEAWLRERGIAWREDETNRDPTFTRNRLRHEIVPLLRHGFNPQLDQALGTLAILARDEEEYWDAEVTRRLPPATSHQPLILPTLDLTGAPLALARRLVRRAVEIVKGDLHGIDFAHIERVLEMIRSAEGHDRMQAPGLDVCRSFEWIQFARLNPEARRRRDFSVPLVIPGSVELPGSTTRIVLQVLEKLASGSVAGMACARVVDELDWQRLHRDDGAPNLELRNWRPGDQYRRMGETKPEKVKFFFQEARVPLWERREWPIITYDGNIVWARRFGAAAEFASGPGTRSVLQVAETGR